MTSETASPATWSPAPAYDVRVGTHDLSPPGVGGWPTSNLYLGDLQRLVDVGWMPGHPLLKVRAPQLILCDT